MNKEEEKEFKALEKENDEIRDKIKSLLWQEFSSIDDTYSDICINIDRLIENEI